MGTPTSKTIYLDTIWYWKKGENPWENDSNENWTEYSNEQQKIINEAYYSGKKDISIGDYVISFCGQFQYHKKEHSQARPIKFVEKRKSRILDELPQPKSKTINDVDYLEYPKIISEFLEEHENMKIVDFLDEFVTEMNALSKIIGIKSETLKEHIRNMIKNMSQMKNLMKNVNNPFFHGEEFIGLANKDPGFQIFKKEIISIYTLPLEFYQKLNQGLREENKEILLKFSHYFLVLDCLLKNDFIDLRWNKSVFRGCQFSKEQIQVYQTILDSDYPSFLWNSFISTTKNKNIAQIFGENNTLIEIQFDEQSFGIDISSFSEIKDEEEILLPARGFYKVMSVSEVINQNYKYHIILKKIHQHKYFSQNQIVPFVPELPVTNMKRVIRELIKLEIEYPLFHSKTHFKTLIIGPTNTPYEGGFFQLDVDAYGYNPKNEMHHRFYPFVPPKVLFETKIWHPNIATKTGKICLDILQDHWNPALTLRTVILSIQSLLDEPNFDNPIEPAVGEELIKSKELFNKTAKQWTMKYAARGQEIEEYVKTGLNQQEAIKLGIKNGIFKNI